MKLAANAVAPDNATTVRELIVAALASNAGVVELPPGEVWIDRPLPLRECVPGALLTGHGTVLRSAAGGTVFDVQPPGLGWRLAATPRGNGIDTPGVYPGLGAGNWCYLFRGADGASTDYGRVCQRRRVMDYRHQAGGWHARLDAAADGEVDTVKTFERAWAVDGGHHARSARLTLRAGDGMPDVGEWLLLTDGPRLGNECSPTEFRLVVAVEGLVVILDRPLDCDYSSPLLCRVRPLVGLRIEGVSALPGPGAAGWAGYLKGCPGLRLDGFDPGGNLDIATCSDVTLNDCRGQIGLNGVTGAVVRDSRLLAFHGEEGCTLTTLRDSDVIAAPQNGIQWGVGSDRLTVRDVRVTGAAASALAVGGADCVLDGVTVDAGPGAPSWVGGDRLRVRGLRHNARQVYFHGGTHQRVSDSDWAAATFGQPHPPGWPEPPPSSGRAYHSSGPWAVEPHAAWETYGLDDMTVQLRVAALAAAAVPAAPPALRPTFGDRPAAAAKGGA